MASAAEHFAWARQRAMEYVELGDGVSAMASLISDLRKHPGTARILTADLEALFMGELMVGGVAGARRFIDGLPTPAAAAEGFTCPRCGRTSHHPIDHAEGYCGACHDWTAGARTVEEGLRND